MPTPQKFDFDALYPTGFEAVFQGDAHHFTFSDFIDTNPSTPAVPADDTWPSVIPRQRLVSVAPTPRPFADLGEIDAKEKGRNEIAEVLR